MNNPAIFEGENCTIRIHNGDCKDAMADMQENGYELAIIDPPYELADKPSRHGGSGAGKLKNRTLNKSAKKFKEWDKTPAPVYFEMLKRVSKNRIIWGGNYLSMPPTRGIICWDKCQPWPNFSQVEMAWTSFNAPARLFRYDNRTGDKIHPTQKPVALYKWLLNNYATEGDTIIDTHMGSGSIAIACWDLGFDLDAWEIDSEYWEAACERLEKHTRQLQFAFSY